MKPNAPLHTYSDLDVDNLIRESIAAEREACAQTAEQTPVDAERMARWARDDIAAAIRARGESK